MSTRVFGGEDSAGDEDDPHGRSGEQQSSRHGRKPGEGGGTDSKTDFIRKIVFNKKKDGGKGDEKNWAKQRRVRSPFFNFFFYSI